MIREQYLENSWRCHLATIANYYLVCCEAVRPVILATAWLLVNIIAIKTATAGAPAVD